MNYAIIDLGGSQQKVSQGDTIHVDLLGRNASEQDAAVSFDRVLLVRSDEGTKIGSPLVEGAAVTATVLGETKGKKVIVFKKKRRKQYRRKNGHRERFTVVRIEEIQAGS